MFPYLPSSKDLAQIHVFDLAEGGLDLHLHEASTSGSAACPKLPAMRLTLLVVLEGEYTLDVGGELRVVGAGQTVILPATTFTSGLHWSVGEGDRARALAACVSPETVAAAADGHELVFPAAATAADEAVLARAKAWADALRAGGRPAMDDVRAALEVVLGQAERAPRDAAAHVRAEIDRTHDRALELGHYADLVALHPDYMARLFSSRFGMPPVRYRLMRRVYEAARRLVAQPTESTLQVAYAAGFCDLRFFNRSFRDVYGLSPRAFRDSVRGVPSARASRSGAAHATL